MQRRKQQDWIRTARERWPKLVSYRKQILATLTVISGFEDWKIGADGLIAASLGHFDQADYDRQLKQGVGS